MTQADTTEQPSPSTLSKKSVDETKGLTNTVQPSKKGDDIEEKTSSQGHTVSKPLSPSSLSKQSDDITKGIPTDPSQIHVESESAHTIPILYTRRSFLHSESAQAVNAPLYVTRGGTGFPICP